MANINFATREVSCKIVYYGPGRSGKTTNLEWIHAYAPSENVGDIVSLATEKDRTLFFDFLPIDLGKVAGMRTKFQLYTVPGQTFYDATRRIVLEGADGVVFVADSHPEMAEENAESLANLARNLEENHLDVERIPLVFQWNKRDLDNAMPVQRMEEALNPRGVPSFESIAIEGEGVLPTLKRIASLVLARLNEERADDERADAEAAESVADADDTGSSPEWVIDEEPQVAASDEIVELEAPAFEPEQPALALEQPPPDDDEEESEFALEEPEFDDDEKPAPGDDAEPALALEQPERDEDEQPPPAAATPRSRREKTSAESAGPIEKRRRSEPVPAGLVKRTFWQRMITGALAALFVLAVQAGFFWGDMVAAWRVSIGMHAGGPALLYLSMIGIVLGVLVTIGTIAALRDRRLVRCFELGVAYCALLVMGVSAYRTVRPAPPRGSPDAPPIAVRLAEIAVSPAIEGRIHRLKAPPGEAPAPLDAVTKRIDALAAENDRTRRRIDTLNAAVADLKKAVEASSNIGKNASRASSGVAASLKELAGRIDALGAARDRMQRRIDSLAASAAKMERAIEASGRARGASPAPAGAGGP